jgi:mRNA interferase RelE/StbE
MMLDLSKSARDFLGDLPAKQFKQVAGRIHDLLREPFPQDAKHLSGYPGYRRIDAGEFRMCYTVVGELIRVVVVGKRNDDAVYKELERKGLA